MAQQSVTNNNKTKWVWMIPFGLLLLVIGLRILDPQPMERMRHLAFDALQQAYPRAYQPLPVRIVDIDEASLKKLGQWPWPRSILAELINKLSKGGAQLVGIDILLSEPDRTSPEEMAKLWKKGADDDFLDHLRATIPDPDSLLVEAFKSIPIVISFLAHHAGDGRIPGIKTGFAFVGDSPESFIPRYSATTPSLEKFETEAEGNGSSNSLPDSDGLLRRIPLLVLLDQESSAGPSIVAPGLVAEAVRVHNGVSSITIKGSGANQAESYGMNTGVVSLKIGSQVIPTSPDGSIWLHFTDSVDSRYLSAIDVLEGKVPAEEIDGTIILIGSSAEGLKDRIPTPLNPVMAGVEVHAQALEQILAKHYIERPDWIGGFEIISLLVFGMLLIILLRRSRGLYVSLVAAGGITFSLSVSVIGFTHFKFLIDPLYPVIGVLLIYLSGSLLVYLNTERERRQISGAFSRYLSPVMVKRLADNPQQLKLGGESREMTLLFADIRDFTSISENMDAEELTRFLNRFLTPMTQAIMDHQGTIDKYMGDAIMAFWNAPLNDHSHPENACLTALDMQKALEVLNNKGEFAQNSDRDGGISIGIGINSGCCSVGNLGSDQRFDYSVIGDAVNLASRLEGQSKYYGIQVVVGEATQKQVDGFAFLELDLICVLGKQKPELVFGLLGGSELLQQPHFNTLLEVHHKMLSHYRRQEWEEAMAELESCRLVSREVMGCPALSGLYLLYQQRIEEFVKTPPGPGWDGVYFAESK